METDKVWPPKPDRNKPKPGELTCPNCGRKLLTQTSVMCNWCGAPIADEDYQEKAAQARLERDQAERAAVEAVVAEEAQYGVRGRLLRRGKAIRKGEIKHGNELKP
jgi:hypothetical protein